MYLSVQHPHRAHLADAERRGEYLKEAHRRWQARRNQLKCLLHPRDEALPGHRVVHYSQTYAKFAMVLHGITPADCKVWSQQIVDLSGSAHKTLALTEESSLRILLELLTEAMASCSLMNLSRDGAGSAQATRIAVMFPVHDTRRDVCDKRTDLPTIGLLARRVHYPPRGMLRAHLLICSSACSLHLSIHLNCSSG